MNTGAFEGILTATDSTDYPWIDKEGVSHQSKEDYLHGVLGFCGCGCPGAALDYVWEIMELIAALIPGDGWETAWHRLDDHFKGAGEKYFVYYYLDAKGFTEHGGSVPGWLTDNGKNILAMLREARSERDPEECTAPAAGGGE